MRVKIATSYPLDKYHCWFSIEKSLENQSIHQLAKQIVNKLELEAIPSNLKLLLEGYQLLPQTKIKEVLRDGDLITIKQNQPKNTDIVKKRKRSIEEDTHLKKKIKKEKEPKKTEKKPKDQKSKKTSEDQKPEKKSKDQKPEKVVKKKKESKKLEKKREDREKKKKTKKLEKQKEDQEKKKNTKDIEKEEKDNKNKKQGSKPMAEVEKQKTSKVQSVPFEGSQKTKKRNQRRRLLKQLYRQSGTEQYQEQASDEEQYQEQAPTEEQYQEQVSSKEQHQTQAPVEQMIDEVQTLNITEPSTTLLKKNKNKKKNHLKGPKADNWQHVYYEEPVQDEPEQTTSNHYGRAFITFAESDPYYKGNNMSPHKYPIHDVSTLFYAEKSSTEKETEKEPKKQPEKEPKQVNVPINYDSYPDVDFKSNTPFVGSQLAIKTLELTANYTPEISEWKQVILKELHLPSSITVEFMPGFHHVNTKGGKFDNKAHEKRDYDDWEHFEEEQEEEEEDRIVTLNIDNVFVVKNMST